MHTRYTITLSRANNGAVLMEITPPISKADVAAHIAKMKVDGVGFGPVFDYAIAMGMVARTRSKGITAVKQGAKSKSLWVPS